MSELRETTPAAAPRSRLRRRVRVGVRLALLIAAVLCLAPISGRPEWLAVPGSLSGLVAASSALATRALPPIVLIGLAVALVSLWRHRWFCRWICPMGLCMDGAGALGRRVKCRPWRRFRWGRWILALTLGGAIVGYPLLLWLDPLALFSSVFLVRSAGTVRAAWVGATLVTTALVGSFLRPNLWCGGVCPLGAFQDGLVGLRRWLKSSLQRGDSAGDASAIRVDRRWLLAVAAGAGLAGVARLPGSRRSRPLRPPGAVDEASFAGLCTRCGNCVRACPHGVIRRDLMDHGWLGLMTPVLRFDEGYCREDCVECTLVCPSGSLSRVHVEDKASVCLGEPHVNMDLCLLGHERECSACMRWCPYGAIDYVFSEAQYTLVPVIDQAKCNGCGACESACPTRPTRAITIRPA